MGDIKIFTDNIDGKALNQIFTLNKYELFDKIRIMPDVHAGKGCVIGFTATMTDKVVPNIVGVDIGCGMLTVELGNIDIDFELLDKTIRECIPSGRNINDRIVYPLKLEELNCYKHLKNIDWITHSIGTLGGGNHFIEIDVDENNNKYLIIHTGSRNLGKQVAEYYQNLAVKNLIGKRSKQEEIQAVIKFYKESGKEKEISSAIQEIKNKHENKIPKELCYLTGANASAYMADMMSCQHYASKNREFIAWKICDSMNWNVLSKFETIHNYIDYKDVFSRLKIVRKGAISAEKGERVLIPINMRDGCIIGIGKGNDDWNYSAPHGAGRIMSRSQAKEIVSLDEYKQSMEGIYSTSVNISTIDESPMAYKPINDILKYIEPTIEVEKIIKPIYNFKASEVTNQ